MKIPQWMIAVAVLLALLLFAVVSRVGAQPDQHRAEPPDFYKGLALDAELLKIDKQALDEAYRAHVIKLWTIYVTDGAAKKDYIRNGLAIARRAYDEVRDAIAIRQQKIQEQKTK